MSMNNKRPRDLWTFLNPDKKVKKRAEGPSELLADMFQNLCFKTGMKPERWGSLMADFVRNPVNRILHDKKHQTSAKGNLTKEFMKEQMTWKVFWKAMRFMQFFKIEIRIRAYITEEVFVEHEVTGKFGPAKKPINSTNDQHHLTTTAEGERPVPINVQQINTHKGLKVAERINEEADGK